ncbi:MAG: MlaD family protein [Saprospiraceae bacterium]|nr:MlaD family protein [Saprospiraceae bacterium]
MAKSTFNNLRLGVFVVSGLLFLIVMLYMIGKDTNMFSSSFQLRTHFRDVKGLQPGNNVLFAGKQIGTVKGVEILNDTTIEVLFYIETKSKEFLRKNSVTSIGSDGLVGNRVLNITPGTSPDLLVEENDILLARAMPDTDEMLETLYSTNNNIAFISEELKKTLLRINESKELWGLLGESNISEALQASLNNIHRASSEAVATVDDLHSIIKAVKRGEGSVGSLLSDTTLDVNLNDAIEKIQLLGENANLLVDDLNKTVLDIQTIIDSGKGPVNALMKDSTMTNSIHNSLINIEKSTASFNQNMEALRQNFLFRAYFKKLEKQQKKEAKNKN